MLPLGLCSTYVKILQCTKFRASEAVAGRMTPWLDAEKTGVKTSGVLVGYGGTSGSMARRVPGCLAHSWLPLVVQLMPAPPHALPRERPVRVGRKVSAMGLCCL